MFRKFNGLLGLSSLALLAANWQPCAAQSVPPTLSAGMNLPYLLENPGTGDGPIPPLPNPSSDLVNLPSAIAVMKAHGVRVVRLPISAEPLLPNPDNGTGNYKVLQSSTYLASIDAALTQLTSAGFVVVLNMRITSQEQALQSLMFPQNYGQMWQALAAHVVQKFGPTQVLFELVNEPHLCAINNDCTADWSTIDLYNTLWSSIQNIWLADVRAVAPKHTIILTSDGYSDFSYLVRMHPVADKNVIYTFHYYEPMIFTDQGLTGSGQPNFMTTYGVSDGLEYPANTANCIQIEAAATKAKNAGLVPYVVDYCAQWTSKARIGTDFFAIKSWATQNKVTVWAGEWGVFPSGGVSRQSRINYLTDMASIFNEYGIGSAAWEYQLWLSQMSDSTIDAAAGFPHK